MTAIDLVVKERQDQVHKHGYTLEHDLKENPVGELRWAAIALIDGTDMFPHNWNKEITDALLKKPLKKRLVIAAALLIAEIERLHKLEENESKNEVGGLV